MKKILYSLAILGTSLSLSGQEEEKRSDAHRSNYRHISLGLNIGNTLSLGDGGSFIFGDPDVDPPNGAGGFEIGFRGHLTYFVTPSIGFTGSAGYHGTSGTARNAYFYGNTMDGDLSMALNLSNWLLRGRSFERKSAVLFTVGLGIQSIWSKGFVDGNVVEINGPTNFLSLENRATQAIVPLQFIYKYKWNDRWDFDAMYRHVFQNKDYPDAIIRGNTGDMQGYIGVGATYNFGPKDDGKSSIIYANPLDDMFGEMQEIKEKFDDFVRDTDGDGVPDLHDKDNATPEGVAVGPNGLPLDSDGDGIPDYLDADPFTPKGAQVDSEGRAVDSDGDGVPDYMDKEPNTREGALVNFQGVEISGVGGGGAGYLPSTYFAFNSAVVTASSHQGLAEVARALKDKPNAKVQLIGYADKTGPEEYNRKLSERRAKAVAKLLVQIYGIAESRIETSGKGNEEFLAEGRNDVNRRVDVMIK